MNKLVQQCNTTQPVDSPLTTMFRCGRKTSLVYVFVVQDRMHPTFCLQTGTKTK